MSPSPSTGLAQQLTDNETHDTDSSDQDVTEDSDLIPHKSWFYYHLMNVLSDGVQRTRKRVISETVERAGLQEFMSSPADAKCISYRIGRAIEQLSFNGVVSSPKRGEIRITNAGISIFRNNPDAREDDYWKTKEYSEWWSEDNSRILLNPPEDNPKNASSWSWWTNTTYPRLYLPGLQIVSEGSVRTRSELRRKILELSAGKESFSSIPPGRMEAYVEWAITDLLQSKSVEKTPDGLRITPAGRDLILANPQGVPQKTVWMMKWQLRHSPEALAERRQREASGIQESTTTDLGSLQIDMMQSSAIDPIDQIKDGVDRIRDEAGEGLLALLQEKDESFFAKAVVHLLLNMGYGGNEKRVWSNMSRSPKNTLEGVIDQDVLGMDQIYVQARKLNLDHVIDDGAIHSFIGILPGKGVSRGIFLTTGRFSDEARRAANPVGSSVILIDSDMLTQLMIQHHVGVEVKKTYTVVGVNRDFFLDS